MLIHRLRTVHLRLTATTRKSLELSTVPLGGNEYWMNFHSALVKCCTRIRCAKHMADRVLTTWSCTVMPNHKRPGGGCLLSSFAGVSCVFFVSCAVHWDPCFHDFSSFCDCNTLFACSDFQFRSKNFVLIF